MGATPTTTHENKKLDLVIEFPEITQGQLEVYEQYLLDKVGGRTIKTNDKGELVQTTATATLMRYQVEAGIKAGWLDFKMSELKDWSPRKINWVGSIVVEEVMLSKVEEKN